LTQISFILKTTNRYVLFYCDECELLKPVITVFRGVHPTIEIHTSSDPADMFLKIATHPPDLILVYLNDPENEYISLVKEIRSNTLATSIPVVIYKALPGDDELKTVFEKIARQDL